MTTFLPTKKTTSASKRRARATVAPPITHSIVPQGFEWKLGNPDAGLESTIRTDGAFQLAVEKFSDARRDWWVVLSTGTRVAIDRAAWELTVRYAAGIQAVYAVAIRAMKAASDEKDSEIRRLQARLEQLTEQRDHAYDEARESRQIPAPIKVELTLPTDLPDLNVNVKPSAGIELVYDAHGRVVGTRPRGTDPVTKAIKKTQAGQSIVP